MIDFATENFKMEITLTAVFQKVPEGYIGYVEEFREQIHKAKR